MWSSNKDDQLIFNKNAPPFDYGLICLNLGRLKMKYIHGYLESIKEGDANYNRYIYGKGLEWSNKSDLVISLSEVGIYQGEDRPVDLSYLNPLSNNFEIEINNRNNKFGNNQNAVCNFQWTKFLIIS